MFCPKCGQEQASESLRFCARCGYKLNAVEQGVVKRLVGMAMYLLLTAAAIFGWGSFSSTPSYMQIRFLITALAAVTFYLLFSQDLKRQFNKLREPTQESAFPPGAKPLASLQPHRTSTAEMVSPPSVTEQTTTLLDRSSSR